jgi:hypothetical protein
MPKATPHTFLFTGFIIPLNDSGTPTAGALKDYDLGLEAVFNKSYLPVS